MAQCPQCAQAHDDSPLVHTLLTENLAAYSCGRCLGTLVSLVSYRAWRESSGRSKLPPAEPAVAASEVADSTGAKKCPKCRSLMSKYRISAEKSNRLDYCSHCEEVWLDEGEWELVESLVARGDFTRVFTQAWQYAIRGDVSQHMEEQRLRERLGADYERVAQFAQWLQSHPSRNEILTKLSRGK